LGLYPLTTRCPWPLGRLPPDRVILAWGVTVPTEIIGCMLSILDAFNGSQGTLVLLLILAVAILAVAVVMLAISLRADRNRWRRLFDGAQGETLERRLDQLLRAREEDQVEWRKLRDRVESLDRRIVSAKRFAGLVHYDAFDDVGGDQSFALALYDERGDGIVLTSVVGRASTRLYCKTLVEGHSDRQLGDEELQAIEQAALKRQAARAAP